MYMPIGAVFIFFSSAYVGMAAASLYRLRVKQLEAFCCLIAHIGAQIDGFLAPLDEIFRCYSDGQLSRIGFLEAVSKVGCTDALEECRKRLYLKSDECAVLFDFFKGLGHSLASEEVKHCLYYEKKLTDIANAARSDLAPKMKMCRALGVIIGIMLVVILL